MNIDLHIHTTYSRRSIIDPEGVQGLVNNAGLRHWAVTDHNSIDFYKTCGKGMSGVEIKALMPLQDKTKVYVHLLFYGFSVGPAVEELMERVRAVQIEKDIKERRLLNSMAGEMGLEGKDWNIVTFARVIGTGGLSISQFINKQRSSIGAFHTNVSIDYHEVIQIMREAGGVGFLAHPKEYPKECTQGILQCAKETLDGIECVHSGHGYQDCLNLLDFCKWGGMKSSGGSDTNGDLALGINYPNLIDEYAMNFNWML